MIPARESPLEAVPDDVFLIVFSLLDVTDLLKCTQLCHRFHRLVGTDTSLQYKIELVKSGMVDGPACSGTMGTGDCLDILRAYNARLYRGEYSCVQDCSLDSDAAGQDASWELVWSTGASIAYVARKAGRSELVLSVPPVSHVEGVWRRRPNVVVPLDEFGQDALLATDYTQDLLVGVRKHIDDSSAFQIHIGSLKDGKIGHPMARTSVLATSIFDQFVQHTSADVHALRIYSQYVFLVVYVDQMGPYEFQVWNWITGTPLMKTIVATMGTPRFTLIDDAHFAVIGSRENRISVYRFLSDADHAGSAIAQFVLALPGAGTRPVPTMPSVFFFIHEMSASLPHLPSAHDPDNATAFTMNPNSTVLMLEFTSATGLASGNYVLLVPISSFREAMTAAYGRSKAKTSLDWGEWGGDALLLHRREPELGMSWIYPVLQGRPYGSRMPLLVYPDAADTTVGQFVIVEMDPWASRYARRTAEAEGPGLEPATTGAVESLQKHVRLDIHGHKLRPNYTVYRGPLVSLPRGVESHGVVLDEHGVSILFAPVDGEQNDDMICGFQIWALV